MTGTTIRNAMLADLPQITDIYNHYVINTPITFDLQPFTPEQRRDWFVEHSGTQRFQTVVAEQDGKVLGYAGTGSFRAKQAYETTVEMTIYCSPENQSRGIGSLLYAQLFEQLKSQDIHRACAGITLPNDASIALHRKFGFKEVGVFSENGRKLGRYWDVLWMERLMP